MTNTLHIYTRVSSTIQQEEGTSLENQKQLGIRKAQELGTDYRLWNEGGQSSFFDDLNNRPVLVSLLALIESGTVKNVFVYNADRLSRNQQTWAVIRYKLLKHGVTLHTASGQMKLKNPVDDLMLGILSEISQYDNRIRSERSRMGRFQKVQMGSWKGGPPPFGYRLEKRKLVIDDFESEWVKKIYDWYCLGVSVKDIQGKLNATGVMTRRQNKHWSLGSIRLILMNTIYAGSYDYTDKLMGETVQVASPVIIDPALFQTAQTRRSITRNRPQQLNTTKHFYLLRNLLVCGHCGSPMGGRINKAGHQNMYYCVKNERRWIYRGDDHVKWKRGCDCSMVRSVNIDRTDNLVWGIVTSVIQDLRNLPDVINGTRPVLAVSLDDGDQITSEVQTDDQVPECANDDTSGQPCGGSADDLLAEIQLTDTVDIDRHFPATVEYIQALSGSPRINTTPDEHKKAVITELVDKITVHFDHSANKHRIDVEFKSAIQAALRGLSAKSAVSPVLIDPVSGHIAANNGGEGGGQCLMTSK